MKKELGFVGLGRMGRNMTTHLVEKEYRVIGYDPDEAARKNTGETGVDVVDSLTAMVGALEAPRVVWLMVPSKVVDTVLSELIPLLQPGDTVIDGGNSFYKDSIRRHGELRNQNINFLDCGTSGGMESARNGASIMVGGPQDIFDTHEHIFEALAAPNGHARVGKEGAGHFIKMIHNGIEYGMMGAIAEGMALVNERKDDFDIPLENVLKVYAHESIITSRLVSWLADAYEQGQIDMIAGTVPQGETETEMEHITTLGNVSVLEAALEQRKQTRIEPSYLGKLVAAMRNQFGGHKTIAKE